MRRLCAAIITVVLLAGSVVGVAGQDEADSEPLVAVTGARECMPVADGLTEFDENGVEHLRSLTYRCALTTGDERLDDPYILIFNRDCLPVGRCTVWGTTETEGPDGWRGTFRGWVGEAGDKPALVGVAEGFGAYEGLTFVNGSDFDTVDGVIFEGPPPWDEAAPE